MKKSFRNRSQTFQMNCFAFLFLVYINSDLVANYNNAVMLKLKWTMTTGKTSYFYEPELSKACISACIMLHKVSKS